MDHETRMNSMSLDCLRGEPDVLGRQIPPGTEVVVTEGGRAVGVLAAVEIECARRIVASLRRLRLRRPAGRIDLDPMDCMEISDLPGREQGTWMVFDDRCRQVLGRGSSFEDCQVLARSSGLIDPVIMGTPRFNVDDASETEILFVTLGPKQ